MDNKAKEQELKLIAEAQQGSDEAFTRLLATYQPLLLSLASRFYLPGSDKVDTVQEARIGFWRALKNFDPAQGSSFGAFANFAVNRHLIMALKGSTRLKHIALNKAFSMSAPLYADDAESPTVADTIADRSAADPVAAAAEEELTQKVREAIVCKAHLSNLEMRVMVLYMRGYSYHQAAAVVGRTHRSVDNCLQRVKRKVGEAIAEVIAQENNAMR